MSRLLLSLSLFALSPTLPLAHSSELKDTLIFAHASFLQGRFEEAERSYRYAVALDPNDLGALSDLAATLAAEGRPADADALWLKATLLAPQDARVREERAWNLLEQGRYEEAHDQFRAAVAESTGPAAVTVYIGDGLAYSLDHERDEAAARFKAALLAAPGQAAPAVLLAEVQEQQGDAASALTWYRRALQQDPVLREAEEGAARTFKARGEPEAAWQLSAHLLESDADDPAVKALARSLRSSLRKRTDSLLPVRRLAWPLLDKPQPAPSGPELRVALFADAAGNPGEISSFTFVCNTSCRVIDRKIGDITASQPFQAWRAVYDAGNGLLSLRAMNGGESYATRNPVDLVPEAGGDLVIKEAVIAAAPGRDVGDRELRGRLSLEPAAGGLRLVLASGVEDYVRGALALAVPDSRYPESLKALATVLRARALARAAGATLHPGAGFTHCDSAHCGLFLGVQEENPPAAQAVVATRGWNLTSRGAPIEALDHVSCGGHTQSAEGLGRDAPYLTETDDGATPPPTPSGLERFTETPPPATLLDLAAMPEGSAIVRWTRVLDGARLEERLGRMGLKGHLKDLLPGMRTSGGRLLELRAVGTKNTLILKGPDIERALSPGSLRSTLFTMRVLRRRGRVQAVLLWGAGTGYGMGFCRMGADGLASQGKSARQILEHYFPKAELMTADPVPQKKPASAKTGGKRKK